MKKLILLACLLTLTTFTACSKEKDQEPTAISKDSNGTVSVSKVKVQNSTIEDLTKTFTLSLINADAEALAVIYKSNDSEYTPKAVVNINYPRFKDKKLSDFTYHYKEIEGKPVVMLQSKENTAMVFSFFLSKINDKFYVEKLYLEDTNINPGQNGRDLIVK